MSATMLGKVPEDSFQTIFDLSFDADDQASKSGTGSTSPSTFANINNSKTSKDEQDLLVSKRWRTNLVNSSADELEQAFSKLFSNEQEGSSATLQDTFANSFFPFSLDSPSTEKTNEQFENSLKKKLLYSSALTAGNISSASSTCSSNSSPSANSVLLPGPKVNSSRYKTELCRPYQENGICKYGDKCQFAHGMPDLRTVNRHPKYKTDLCRTYHSVGFCPYGPRCHFIHCLDEIKEGQPVVIGSGSRFPNPYAKPATSDEIAAAIAALKLLPAFKPEGVAPPPGFAQGRPQRASDNFGLSYLASSESSGFSSASSLSPSLLPDLDDIQSRLPVFSRFAD